MIEIKVDSNFDFSSAMASVILFMFRTSSCFILFSAPIPLSLFFQTYIQQEALFLCSADNDNNLTKFRA